MKRTLTALSFLVLIAAFLLFSLDIKQVCAQNNGYSIQNVDHQVEVIYSGNVVIRDTITLTGQSPNAFHIGFPYKYGNHILKAFAFDPTGTLPMNLGVQLGNRSGFYGVEINLSERRPQIFTIIFILSNSLLSRTLSASSLDFPVYPGFAQGVARCSVALVLPAEPSSLSITKPDGNISTASFVKENLEAFAYSPAIATFTLPAGSVLQMDVKSLNRIITVYPAGEIRASDSFRITNNSTDTITTLQLDLPVRALNVAGKDEFGRTLRTATTENGSFLQANLTLLSSISPGQSASVTVEYNLPNTPPALAASFTFDLDLFPVANYFVAEATVRIVLPEGAHFVAPQLSAIGPSLSVTRELFQETMEITQAGVSIVDRTVTTNTNSVQVVYDYNVLWLSFRPTFWVWGLFIAGSVVITIWRRPKGTSSRRAAVPRLSAGLSPDNVRAFTEAYEERKRIAHELRLLHVRAQKGKIPRNYYKSQRKTLEQRFSALSKNINQLKDTFRSAGGKYGDLIRQLDAAENELEKARASIRTAEGRHKTGELPIENYKKALADYQRQKEKLDLQINGILLRLREETH